MANMLQLHEISLAFKGSLSVQLLHISCKLLKADTMRRLECRCPTPRQLLLFQTTVDASICKQGYKKSGWTPSWKQF